MLTMLYLLSQSLWLKVGRKISFRLYRQLGALNSYKSFSSDPEDVFAKARRDFSYYNRHIDFSGKKALDVGCSAGRKTAYYSTVSMEVVGIDVNKLFIKNARDFVKDRRFKRVDFLVADAAHLPFKRNSFDIVMSNDTLEHVKDCSGTVFEMERVVNLGGHICINFGPLWRSPFGSHMEWGEFFSPPWVHLIFPEESIKNTLMLFGKIKEDERAVPLFKHLNRISAREFQRILESTKLKVLFFTLLTPPPFETFLRTPLREFFVTQIVTLLEKVFESTT